MSNQNEGFLPEGYETPEAGGNYMKLKDGDNKFRILSNPLLGWTYWDVNNKPVRLAPLAPPHQKDKPAVNPELIRTDDYGKKVIKYFWALKVYNYAEKKMQVLEFTQQGIQSAIEALYKNPVWGDPKKYDLIINRKGQKKETEYNVMPVPPAVVTEDIKKSYLETPINLQALMTGGDPFQKVEGAPVTQTTAPVAEVKKEETVIPKIENDGLPF